MNSLKILIPAIILFILFAAWFLFRPSTDEILLDHYKTNTTMTFDVPMVYVTNCSQCAFSQKAQAIDTFLVPQTFLYEPLLFSDDEFTIQQIPQNETFTIQEVFTNQPHGLEAVFRGDVTYFVITDTQGVTSVTYKDIHNFIVNEADNQYPANTSLLNSIADLDTFWISVDLNQHLSDTYADDLLPNEGDERAEKILAIENEFLSKFPTDQIEEYKLDQSQPRVYLKMNKKVGVLYLLAGEVKFNIRSIGLLYTNEDSPAIAQ